MPESFIEFRQITKRFAGVTALEDVSLSIARGECHALMGENGAGKSTLGKVLAGIHRADAGVVMIDGSARHFRSPADARAAGVGMVHQELAFVPELSVAENLLLGQVPRWGAGLFVDARAMRNRAISLLQRVGVDPGEIDPDRPIRTLSTAQEQMVQIAAAVGSGAKVLVFDEPTSSLSEREARHLFTLVEQLKSQGVTIVYVSHRMPELFRLTDRISVLRDGRYVGTLITKDATEDQLVRMMAGRSVTAFRRHEQDASATLQRAANPPVLEVRNLASPGRFDDVNFTIQAGEIVGLAGLVGAGRSEIAQALFGLDSRASGEVRVDGKLIPLGSVHASMRAGIGLVPEDRKRQGLALGMSCRENFSMAMLPRLARWGFLRGRAEQRLANEHLQRLSVKTPSLETPVAALSGGNQQKVVIAKWLAALGQQGRVLIVDEPTRGVDVGAKAAIHELIATLASRGLAVLMISSELPELLALSHRILVMRRGRLVTQMPAVGATDETVLRAMAGVSEEQ